MPNNHAIFSPSSARVWLHCSVAALMNYSAPEETSEYAEEGTRAHKLMELMLSYEELPEDVDPEMLGYVRQAVDYVRQIPGYKETEKRIDIACNCWGTADVVIRDEHTLHILDLKYGMQRVSAFKNPQLMLYAYGAKTSLETKIVLHIMQPRINHWDVYEIGPEELDNWWYEKVRWIILGDYDKRPQPGPQCPHCKSYPYCRAAQPDLRESELLSLEERAEAWPKVQRMKKWIQAYEDSMIDDALDGQDFPGLKLTRNRGRRVITDPNAMAAALSDYDVYEKKLLPLTKLEKMVGKSQLDLLAGEFIGYKEGNWTLKEEK